uniref:NADP-dependent malic enzyme n=1 Tax=Zea mays TaxID=4577 RepID=A0A804N8T4_MAIZE
SIERAQLGGIAKWAYGAGSSKRAIYHQFCSRGEKGEKGENRIEEAHILRLLDNRYLQWRCINAQTDATLLVQSFTAEGLIVASREETLQSFKKRYAHEHEPVKDLLGAVKAIRPTALIGSAGVGQSFTKEVIEAMSSINEVTPEHIEKGLTYPPFSIIRKISANIVEWLPISLDQKTR